MAKLGMRTRSEVIERQRKAYRKASKKSKGAILDNVCEVTGLSRDRAKRLLSSKYETQVRRNPSGKEHRRRGRKPKYGGEEADALAMLWALMDFACGKRIVAGIGDMIDALERHGEWRLGTEATAKLRIISASTADRLLRKPKEGMRFKGKTTTKPGTLLKRAIPMRRGTDWDEDMPGYVEIDLVAHCGSTTAGDYVNTLDATDIKTGWTETAAVINKAQKHVFAALKGIRAALPFELLGIDSDNGSEFINDELYRYCAREGLTFTRSRPNRKNDNCHVEQKNWHVVRRNIGYNRYEGEGAVAELNKYYSLLRLHTNFLMPQSKLVSKARDGSRVTKRYDSPSTPYKRVLESPHVSEEAKARLRETFQSLNPASLVREMRSSLGRLAALASPLQ